MPPEVGAAALFASLYPSSDMLIVGMTTMEARSFERVFQLIGEDLKNFAGKTHFVLLGTYWNSILPQLKALEPEDEPFVYGETQLEGVRSFDNKKMMITDFIFIALNHVVKFRPILLNVFHKTFKELFDILDERYCGGKDHDCQAFFAGMHNHNLHKTLFERFLDIYNNGEIAPVDLIKVNGKTIMFNQAQLATDRVVRNSRQIVLPDGKLAVVTNATELVELTHEALKKKYPEAELTITVQLKFDPKLTTFVVQPYQVDEEKKDKKDSPPHDFIAYSLRTFGTIDANQTAQLVGGGGANDRVAGFSLPFTLSLPLPIAKGKLPIGNE